MASEVTVVEDQRQSGNFLQAILQAATDPNVDADKVKTMADLAVSLQDRERETQFNQSLNAAIQEMPVITREGIIQIPAKDGKPARVQGRFARFEDIYRVVRPILERHQLAIRFNVGDSPNGVTVQPVLSHANGYTERGDTMRLPHDQSGSKNNTQAVGSAAAYGKRYTLCAMLNIVTEGADTDGNSNVHVSLPYEREQTVLGEAEAAHQAGTYVEWFSTQGPKDRAWLINSGNHERFGGQTRLGGPRQPVQEPEDTGPPPQERTDPPPQQQRKPQASKPSREERATTWVDNFIKELGTCTTAGQVTALQADHEGTIAALDDLPVLKKKLDRAVDDKLASF